MATVTHDLDNVNSEPDSYDWDWLREQDEALESMRPDPECEPLDLAEWVDEQSSYYMQLGTEASAWLARELESLAKRVRFTHAQTPADFTDRLEVLERTMQEREWDDHLRRERAAEEYARRRLTPVQHAELEYLSALAYYGPGVGF
jgi:hypothetical protein